MLRDKSVSLVHLNNMSKKLNLYKIATVIRIHKVTRYNP